MVGSWFVNWLDVSLVILSYLVKKTECHVSLSQVCFSAIRFGKTGARPGSSSKLFDFHLLIIILPLLHTHTRTHAPITSIPDYCRTPPPRQHTNHIVLSQVWGFNFIPSSGWLLSNDFEVSVFWDVIFDLSRQSPGPIFKSGKVTILSDISTFEDETCTFSSKIRYHLP